MRTFSPGYLRYTRAQMWADSTAALDPLALETHDCILDAGCGIGSLSRAIASRSDAEIIGLDADATLLAQAGGIDARIRGDATNMGIRDGAVNLVVCQALLVNLSNPEAALEEFARVSAGLVAIIEPDNRAVRVDSTVDAEVELDRQARAAYIEGTTTDLGIDRGRARSLLEGIGCTDIEQRTYELRIEIEPPYDDHALEAIKRRARGNGLEDHREALERAGLEASAIDRLKDEWRAAGREAARQLTEERYRRCERTPFHVTVGTLAD